MCWINALAQRANRVGMHHSPRSGTAELESFAPVTEPAYVPASEAGFWEFDSPLGHHEIDRSPCSSVGGSACLVSRRSSVRIRPGAPVSQRLTFGEVTSLSSWPDGFDPRTLYQAVTLRMRVKACANSVAAE